MKHALRLTILACVIFMATGCSADQYSIERQYWQIQKRADRIFSNSEATPPRELEKAVNLLNQFSLKYPKSNLAVDADFTVARLYIVKNGFDSARVKLKSSLGKYNDSVSVCAEALFLIGNTYELQNKWAAALEEYQRIIQNYPQTQRGLDMPVYISQHYKIKKQPEKMNLALQDAIAHYNSLAGKYPNTRLAFSSYVLAAQSYAQLNDWRNAVNTYNTILLTFKNKVNLSGIMFEMALIYDQRLKDKTAAKGILSQLIRDFPQSKLVKPARKLLKELN